MGGPELVMGEFTYCTSLDHAKWFIQDPETQGVKINPEMLDEYPGKRFQIKKWIENVIKSSLNWEQLTTCEKLINNPK